MTGPTNNWGYKYEFNMKINNLLNSIKTQLNTQFPELKTCEIHDGRFDVAELKRVSTKTPAMHISVLTIPKSGANATEEVNSMLNLVIYIITSDQHKLTKGEAARNLVETLLPIISHQRWGEVGVGEAISINAQNLFNSTANKGIALWAVTWKQDITLGETVFDQDSVIPSELYADGELQNA
jgi:hypothetical protein